MASQGNLTLMKAKTTLIIFIMSCLSLSATNIVTYALSDSATTSSDKLKMAFLSLSNADDHVRIIFELTNTNTPFSIYKAEWINRDSINSPLEPFSLIAHGDEVEGKNTIWTISLDFPFSDRFGDDDVLVLTTDKGLVKCHTSRLGELKETIDLLRLDYENKLSVSENHSRRAWIILTTILAAVIIIGSLIYIVVRRIFLRKRKEIEELTLLITERSNRNIELENKVHALYGSRLDTLNMLCNEYFEKSGSEKVKITLYNEVEKHILALRDSKSVEELEKVVNTFLDNILVKIKDQIPELSRNDMTFLTYLYAGFAPRAICIFTDIKIKNFYNRRSRLKERILASDAQDKEYFVSKI